MDARGVLKQLFAAYPNNSATPETVAVYYRQLVSIPLDQLQAMVDAAISTSKFLPTVAELKTLRRDLGLDMTAEERARAYCPDSLRGIAIGCDEVYRQRDQMRLTNGERRMLEAV